MYPIGYEADFNPEPNRWTTFFRIVLVIPWAIVMYVYLLAFLFTQFFAWVALVILGRYPQWLYRFNSGVVRYSVRYGAWAYLQTDAWPPFGLADDDSYPIRVRIAPAAERQSRLKAFFRLVLAVPMAILVYYGVASIQLGLAIVAWSTIVFRGYMPEAVNSALTFVNALYARFFGYVALLTDDYPPVGLERAKPSGAQQLPLPPGAPPPAPPAAAV
jgi:Domain of unknown function (DUF4389)